ncbi:pentapeptide repeat-containing protein [Mesorhizobium xinjiangense]|uniref:pentapeptide repeat-containing protein n=1 Tax=Mesorhizobium xinjiangense TaxID=2678685 RepID=UPI0012ED05D1|nr:pentapeptide repeat-containing protein [Mesorhizobium xinjiangense]
MARQLHGCALGLVLAAFLVPAGTASAANCMTAPAPGTNWENCQRRNLLLTGANLANSNLRNTDFSQTDLRRSDLRAANLESATLVRASLAGAKADEADFTKVEAYRTNFSNVSARDSSFASAELQRADFRNAVLTGVDFQKAEAGRADFTGAELSGTRFTLANLARASFTDATFDGPIDFDGAFLFLTRVEGMDLSAATGLEQEQIDLACGDETTKLPAGMTMPASWPCPFD